MQASSVDLPRPIDTSTTVLHSTVVTKLNVHGVETLIGDNGKTYDLLLKVNLNQSRSRDKDGVVVIFMMLLMAMRENKREASYKIPCRVWLLK